MPNNDPVAPTEMDDGHLAAQPRIEVLESAVLFDAARHVAFGVQTVPGAPEHGSGEGQR